MLNVELFAERVAGTNLLGLFCRDERVPSAKVLAFA
jgi:hypothetical protein